MLLRGHYGEARWVIAGVVGPLAGPQIDVDKQRQFQCAALVCLLCANAFSPPSNRCLLQHLWQHSPALAYGCAEAIR